MIWLAQGVPKNHRKQHTYMPFDATKANSITTMLGSCDLCKTVITFLMDNSNHLNLIFKFRKCVNI